MAAKYSQPRTISNPSKSSSRPIKRQRTLCTDDEDSDDAPRKQHRRVSKACERCRLKKTKCDGEIPCQRCTDEMVTCCEGARKKGGTRNVAESFVDLLEHQQTKFIAGHLKMYKLMVDAGLWPYGEVRKNNRGTPIIHDMLEKLGVVRAGAEQPNSFPESLDENRVIRARLEATKEQNNFDHHNDVELKQGVLESSPPSLVHTDRESSIETCSSEIKATFKSESNPMITGTDPGFISGLQSHELDTCVFISHLPINNYEKTRSNSTQSISTISSTGDIILRNYLARQVIESPWYSDQGNRFEMNQSLVMLDEVQCMSQQTVDSRNAFCILKNPSSPFNAVPDLEPIEYLRPTDININIAPKVMKYAYDPFMG